MNILLWIGLSFLQQAHAIEWPETNTPAYEDNIGRKERAVIISIEEYAFLQGVQNASQNGEDWQLFFTESLGMPKSNVSLLQNEAATKDKILSSIKWASRRLHKSGKLWIVFVGHGITSFEGNIE